ncbi:uncharacterized protein N7483_000590 [Penicillium malachiteum]|uniref:uncharacterized protein n=1 Tax=Penicillium malachiteum TaxID=1324776 RepID=UPI002548F971|nr:uncharacterized protein N7483_000590 [Penicillium malachiteum]KAJ5735465.1 hypothetical protein N7483_000590 [Penicillium malachiteum]
MYWRCDDPSCGCQQAPRPPTNVTSLKMQNQVTGKIEDLSSSNTDLDAKFDIVSGTMHLKQKLRHPELWPDIQHETWIEFNLRNSVFVNLEGLKDNSLLFTFKINSPDTWHENGCLAGGPKRCHSGVKFKIRHQVSGWIADAKDDKGPLFNHLINCPCEESILQLRFSSDRIRGWKTAALVLLTYRQIDTRIWHRIRDELNLFDIAGLNWALVQKQIMSMFVSVNTGAAKVRNGTRRAMKKASISK